MIIIKGKTYQHLFTAGKYPQGSISIKDLNSLASAYNVNFHSAPVWIGHLPPDATHVGGFEPIAYAWIDSLIINGNKLYGSFSDVSPELKYLIESGKFKFVSVELGYYNIAGKNNLYLHAVALTNRPAVDSMEPLNLPDDFTKSQNGSQHNFNKDCQNKLFYNIKFITMNENLLAVAAALGIDTSNIADDKALTEAINAAISKLQSNESSEHNAEMMETKQNKNLCEKISSLENMLFAKLVDDGIAAGKVLPNQRESLIAFAKQNYDACKKLIDDAPVNPLLSKSRQIQDVPAGQKKINLKDAKFSKDGKELTYDEVISDVKLFSKFTDDELLALKEKSK